MYSYNASQPSYPPRVENSLEEYKRPYEDDIIDSYASADVRLPGQQQPQTYPPSAAYPGQEDGRQWLQYPPPIAAKSSYSSAQTDVSDAQSTIYKGGNSHDYGLPVTTEKPESRKIWDVVLPDSIPCRLYVLTVLVETCIDIGIEADLLLRFQAIEKVEDVGTRRLPVYLSIFAFAHLFQLVMAIDAVHARNTLQFLFLTLFNAVFLVYAVIQIFEIRESFVSANTVEGISDVPVNVLTTIIPIVISVAEIAYIGLGWKIWREFGWKVYKQLGADRQVKRMYAHYQIFLCLIKFDVFFFLGFSVQLIWLVLNSEDWEWYVTCGALPCSFLLLLYGHYSARNENKYMMFSFILGSVGALVYFVYKLLKIVKFSGDSAKVAKTLTVFAVIAIIFLLGTIIMASLVLRNFGGGLKYHMTKHAKKPSLRRRGTEHQHRHQHSYPMGHNPNRMTID